MSNTIGTKHLCNKKTTGQNNSKKQNIDNKANTLQGMHDASEDEMISENYKNIVWSVVAILLIIGSIKLLK